MDVVHAVRSSLPDAEVINLARFLLHQYRSDLSLDELTARMRWLVLQRCDLANLLRARIVQGHLTQTPPEQILLEFSQLLTLLAADSTE